MGAQQLLLILLVTVIVGLAVQTGIKLFDSYNQDSDRDRMVAQLSNIIAHFEACALKTRSMGGGGGTFTGCTAPRKLLQSAAGVFTTIPIGNWLIVLGTGSVIGRDNRTNTRITAIYMSKQTYLFVSN